MTPEIRPRQTRPLVLNTRDQDDPRVAAFCSSLTRGLFHAVAYGTDIWRQDPFDVESIHGNVRETFRSWSIASASRLPCRRAGSCCCWAMPAAARPT